MQNQNHRRLPVVERLERYFATCQSRGAEYIRFNLEVFARRLGVSVRSIKYARDKLEQSGWQIRKSRVGRSFALFVVFDQPERPVHSATLSNRGDFSTRNNNKPAVGGGSLPSKAMRGKAAVMARKELHPLHWDNCKVLYRFGHAFRYALRGLVAGYADEAIVRAYDAALHQRHKDATDSGLGSGNPKAKWEPSSTVSLAAEMLGKGESPEPERHRFLAWYRGCLSVMSDALYRQWRKFAVREVGEDRFLDEDPGAISWAWATFRQRETEHPVF